MTYKLFSIFAASALSSAAFAQDKDWVICSYYSPQTKKVYWSKPFMSEKLQYNQGGYRKLEILKQEFQNYVKGLYNVYGTAGCNHYNSLEELKKFTEMQKINVDKGPGVDVDWTEASIVRRPARPQVGASQ